MALTKEDLDNIQVRTKLGTLEALKDHTEKEHLPLWRKIQGLERNQWYAGGFIAACAALLEFVRNSLGGHQ